jgi:hypothetical protein
MKSIVWSIALAIGIFACSIAPSFAQERSAIKQGFELAPNSGKRILVLRPSVRVGAQSTGGLFEPNADWTEKAKENIHRTLKEYQAKLGNATVVAPEAYGESAQIVEEHMALFASVSQAVIEYQFFVGNRLPTKNSTTKMMFLIGRWHRRLGTPRSKGCRLCALYL